MSGCVLSDAAVTRHLVFSLAHTTRDCRRRLVSLKALSTQRWLLAGAKEAVAHPVRRRRPPARSGPSRPGCCAGTALPCLRHAPRPRDRATPMISGPLSGLVPTLPISPGDRRFLGT